jgi:hypothetical protein
MARTHEPERTGRRVVASVLALVACRSSPVQEEPASKDKEPTGMSELGTSSTDATLQAPPGDACDDAVAVLGRTWRGSLDGATADLAMSDVIGLERCTVDGPDVFVRRRIDRRADVTITAAGTGFVPQVAVIDGSCSNAWVCAPAGLPAQILDVAAGTELVIAVAIAQDDVAAATTPVEATLAIAEREVLSAGASCPTAAGSDGGRCEAGTACVAADAGASTCTPIAGDTCGRAIEVDLGTARHVATIDPALPYSDAHAHACAGERRRDVVFRVHWDGSAGSLDVSTAAPGVALAARAPACTLDAAHACDDGVDDGARIVVAPHSADAASAYVFVELPAEGDLALDEETGGESSELGPFEVAFMVAATGERG